MTHSTIKMLIRAGVGLGLALSTSSCALLANLPGAGGITPPAVTFEGATLAQAPEQRRLEAYYCPEVVPAPLGIPGGPPSFVGGSSAPNPRPRRWRSPSICDSR